MTFFHIGPFSAGMAVYSSGCQTSVGAEITWGYLLVTQVSEPQPGGLDFTVLLFQRAKGREELLCVWVLCVVGKGPVCLFSTQVHCNMDIRGATL